MTDTSPEHAPRAGSPSEASVPQAVEEDAVRQHRAEVAAGHFVRMAERARSLGRHDVATAAEQQAAAAAEAARAQYDYVQRTLPSALGNLARFHHTGTPQMILLTEPHPFNEELFDDIVAAAGATPADFAAEERQTATVPVPPDVQAHLELPEPSITAHVWDSPMADGGMLYKLHFIKRVTPPDGDVQSVEKVMLLASDVQLPPVA